MSGNYSFINSVFRMKVFQLTFLLHVTLSNLNQHVCVVSLLIGRGWRNTPYVIPKRDQDRIYIIKWSISCEPTTFWGITTKHILTAVFHTTHTCWFKLDRVTCNKKVSWKTFILNTEFIWMSHLYSWYIAIE
jgi:hypothetical protein